MKPFRPSNLLQGLIYFISMKDYFFSDFLKKAPLPIEVDQITEIKKLKTSYVIKFKQSGFEDEFIFVGEIEKSLFENEKFKNLPEISRYNPFKSFFSLRSLVLWYFLLMSILPAFFVSVILDFIPIMVRPEIFVFDTCDLDCVKKTADAIVNFYEINIFVIGIFLLTILGFVFYRISKKMSERWFIFIMNFLILLVCINVSKVLFSPVTKHGKDVYLTIFRSGIDPEVFQKYKMLQNKKGQN